MFSFIKLLGSIKEYLKRNKWMWYTSLTVASAGGVLASMLFINSMTQDVAKKTYLEEHRLDTNLLDNFLVSRYESLLSIGSIVSLNPDIMANIKTQSDAKVIDILNAGAKSINNKTNISPIKIKYYAHNYKASESQNTEFAELVMSSNQNISGIVANRDGIRLIGITPINDSNSTIGAIEISQSIHAIKVDFERLGKEFIFVLNKNQLVFLDIAHKTDTYHDIDETYKVAFHNYDSKFYQNLQRLNIEEVVIRKYEANKEFYTTYDETIDLNGREIGLFFIGESSIGGSSFVQITKNMINTITTVALGLVISLILFIF